MWLSTGGPVLTALGLGNLVRGGRGAWVGAVFVGLGLVFCAWWLTTLRHQLKLRDRPPRDFRKQVLGTVLAIAVGTCAYVVILGVVERS